VSKTLTVFFSTTTRGWEERNGTQKGD